MPEMSAHAWYRHANFLKHLYIVREMRHVFKFQIWNITDFEFKFLFSYFDFRKILHHILDGSQCSKLFYK